MNISEMILIVVCVLNIIFMGFMMSLIKDIVSLKIMITQLHSATANIAARSINQEQLIIKLGNAFGEFVAIATSMIDKLDMPGGMSDRGRLYKTMDGRYIGTSIQDLINKIKADNKEDDYISKDDLDKLRGMFEQDNLDDDEDEDSNDSQR